MSNRNYKRTSPSKVILNIVGIVLLTLIILGTIGGMIVGGMVASVMKEAPEIDPTSMIASMNQTSTIYDSEGKLLNKIESLEHRTIVSLDEIPEHLKEAFISIEDERFYTHPGVDIIGIGASIYEQLQSGGSLRGASTITQQLVRNMYLSNERSLARKITEAYLSLQVESILSKDQILEAYLNKIYLGQGAYGVQEAAQTYFDKDVSELTLAESALFAGIVKSTTAYQPFSRVEPSKFDADNMTSVGTLHVLGQDMYLVYNPESVERQHIVLSQMKKHEKITEDEYNTALNESILDNLKPGQKSFHNMTSYPIDYIQTQAAELLAEHYEISIEDARNKVLNDGLQIYSTLDTSLQSDLEDIYDNFTAIVGGEYVSEPFLINWTRDNAGNIIDSDGNVVYFKRENLVDENWNITLPASGYSYNENGDLTINSRAIKANEDKIDLAEVYSINEEKNLVTHSLGRIVIPSNEYQVSEEGITISSGFLENNPDIFSVPEDSDVLKINSAYYDYQEHGITQPQSATVVSDHKSGEIKALVGGRDVTGNMILNRATASHRQPGSAIKPISVYYPALAEGFTAGSIADDVPIDVDGERWPRNAYNSYRGLMTFRQNLDISSNAGTVNALEQLGIDNSIKYLNKMGITDSIITKGDNSQYNDENLSALALGGMTRGLTPLEVTAAYTAIANDGIYIKPRIISKILDAKGNTIIDDDYEKVEITDAGTAWIMKDMLKTVVDNGYTAKPAKMEGMATAGKTGTTQKQADIWFVGMTPYYTIGTWIGSDTPVLTLKSGSIEAATFWNKMSTRLHEGLEPIPEFEQPDGVEFVEEAISSKSGLLSTSSVQSAGHSIEEIFVKGTEPTEEDDSYKSYRVCSASGKKPTEYCPDSSIEYKSVFVRPVPYDPKDHAGFYPPDMGYGSEGPTEYCDVHTKEAYETYLDFLQGPYFRSGTIKPDD